jgi:hypothetical protein
MNSTETALFVKRVLNDSLLGSLKMSNLCEPNYSVKYTYSIIQSLIQAVFGESGFSHVSLG